MPLRDAVKFVLSTGKEGEIQFHLKPSGREVTVRGRTSDTTVLKKIFLTKEYETPFPSNPRVIVDAGANIGLATLYYAQQYPDAKIIAIEPERSNFKVLQKNCAGMPNVILVEGALWGKEVKLVIEDPTAAKFAFSVTESQSTSSVLSEEMQAVTIPGIMRKFGLDRIDILKLDIEGAEYELFKEGAESWLGAIGQIVIELHDWKQPGSAQAFYAAVGRGSFTQANRGENIFIQLEGQKAIQSQQRL